MSHTFKATALAAAAMLVAGSAFAAPPQGLTSSANSSLAFVALDSSGTPASLFVDLGHMFSDFNVGAAIYQPNNTVVWNFNTNSVSVNGIAKPGTYNWSSQYQAFQAAAQVADTSYAVIAGAALEYPAAFLTTGTPTTSQFDAQDLLNTSNMGGVQSLYTFNGNNGTFSQPGFGANAAVNNTAFQSGYAGSFDNWGTNGNWLGSLSWSAMKAEGQQTDFYALNGDFDNPVNKVKLDGTFNYSAGVLTFNSPVVTAVPEPSAWMMSLAGMAVLYGVGRRRREER